MTYLEQVNRIISTHNLKEDTNIADFVDNLVQEVEYYKKLVLVPTEDVDDLFICKCGNNTFSLVNNVFRCGVCKKEYKKDSTGNLEATK